MSETPPIPRDLWDQIPATAQAAVLALVQALERRVAALEARLGQDSSNSSKPPSSDPPHLKPKSPRPPSGKKRGGQPGHGRHTRELVAPEQLTGAVDCKPQTCRDCGHDLQGTDPDPIRHQVAEIPEVRPDIIEYRLHRLTCPRRGAAARGALPAGVPRGAYRLSKRQIRSILADLLGLSISTGRVCKAERAAAEALAAPVDAVFEHVRSAVSAGIDETGWREGRSRAWLWVAVTPQATAFRVARSRGADAPHAIAGEPVGPVVIRDRFPTHARAPDRQTCWAHTIRTQSTNRSGAWLLLGSASVSIARPRGLLRGRA